MDGQDHVLSLADALTKKFAVVVIIKPLHIRNKVCTWKIYMQGLMKRILKIWILHKNSLTDRM